MMRVFHNADGANGPSRTRLACVGLLAAGALALSTAAPALTVSKTYDGPAFSLDIASGGFGNRALGIVEFTASDFPDLVNPVITEFTVEVTFEKQEGAEGTACGDHQGGNPRNDDVWLFVEAQGTGVNFADLIINNFATGVLGLPTPTFSNASPYTGVQTLLFTDAAGSAPVAANGPESGTWLPALPFSTPATSNGLVGYTAIDEFALVILKDEAGNAACVESFTITLTVEGDEVGPPPEGDGATCEDPFLIFGPGSFPFTTTADNINPPNATGCPLINAVFFSWTAPSDGTLTADTFGSDFDTVLAVYGSDACPGDFDTTTSLACNDDAPGDTLQSEVVLEVVEGETYFIVAGGFGFSPPGAFGDGVLNVAFDGGGGGDPGPGGDGTACDDLIVVDSSAVPFTIADNGQSLPGDLCTESTFAMNFPTFYSYTPSASGTVQIDTIGSGVDTYLMLFPAFACVGGELTGSTSACDEFGTGAPFEATISVEVVEGEEYIVVLGSVFSDTGSGTLNFSIPPQGGDPGPGGDGATCGEAIALSEGATPFTLPGSAPDIVGLCPEQFAGTIESPIFYAFSAPENGILDIDTIGSGFDTYLAILPLSACPAGIVPGAAIACDADGAGPPFEAAVSAIVTGGESYLVILGGAFGETGSGNLNVAFTPLTGVDNDDCGGAIAIAEGANTWSNLGATTSAVQPSCGTIQNDLWFTFDATLGDAVTVDTVGPLPAGASTALAVWGAECGAGFPSGAVVCDDQLVNIFQSRVQFIAPYTGTYYVQAGFVGNTQAGGLALNLGIGSPVPANNDCVDATPVALVVDAPETVAFDNTNATTSGAIGGCGDFPTFGPSNDLWYEVVMPANTALAVDTIGSAQPDTKIAAWLASDCPDFSGTPVACNDDISGADFLSSMFIAPASEERTVLLQIGSFLNGGPGVVNLLLTEVGTEGTTCDDPIVVAEGSTPFVTTTALSNFPANCAAVDNFNNALFFAYTATGTGDLVVDTAGSGFDTVLGAFEAANCPALDSPIACNDDAAGIGLQSRVTFPVEEGETYLIVVGGFGVNTAGSGTLNIALTIPEPGDSCSATLELTDAGVSGNNEDRPTDLSIAGIGTGCTGVIGGASFYSYTATQAGILSIDTVGSDFDTKLAVFAAGNCPSTAIACNDDATGIGLLSRVSFPVLEAGTEYIVVVGGWNATASDAFGNYELNLSYEPFPQGFLCDDPIIADLGTQSTTVTTANQNLPGLTGCNLNNTVYFLWTAPCDGTATIDTFTSSYDTVLHLFTADACPGGFTADNLVACNDDTGGLQSEVVADVVGGESYYIVVASFGAAGAGTAVVNVAFTPDAPVIECPDDVVVAICNDEDGLIYVPSFAPLSECFPTFELVGFPDGVLPYGLTEGLVVNIFDLNGEIAASCVVDIEVVGDVQPPVRLPSEALFDGQITASTTNPALGQTFSINATGMSIGDTATNLTQRGIVSFAGLGDLPSSPVITDVTLRLYKTSQRGDAGSLGFLAVDLLDPEIGTIEFGPEDFDSVALAEGIGLPTPIPPTAGGSMLIGIAEEHWATLLEQDRVQMRLYFPTDTNGDGRADNVTFGTGENGEGNAFTPELIISYYLEGCAGCGDNPVVADGPSFTDMVRTTPATDGFVRESFETAEVGGVANSNSQTFLVGDDVANNQHIGILGFNTGSLGIPAGASIDSATLVLRQSGSIRGDISELGDLLVDMPCLATNPVFGNDETVELQDFQAFALFAGAGILEQVPGSFDWAAEIDPALLGNINRDGYTNFKVRFAIPASDNARNDRISFFTSNAGSPTVHPTLIITWTEPEDMGAATAPAPSAPMAPATIRTINDEVLVLPGLN